MFVGLMDFFIESIYDFIKDGEPFHMFRDGSPYGNTYGKINIQEVKQYLSKHDWILNVEDTETGFDAETVFVSSNGQSLKISVYENEFGVYLASDHNYHELSKLENVDSVLGYFDCERCGYLGYDKYECKIETKRQLVLLKWLVATMLIAENIPTFEVFMKNMKKKYEDLHK